MITAAKKLDDEEVRAIAVALADELERRQAQRRSRPHPELRVRPSETDLAAARKLNEKLGLRPKRAR